jgi:hypothetical protein
VAKISIPSYFQSTSLNPAIINDDNVVANHVSLLNELGKSWTCWPEYRVGPFLICALCKWSLCIKWAWTASLGSM